LVAELRIRVIFWLCHVHMGRGGEISPISEERGGLVPKPVDECSLRPHVFIIELLSSLYVETFEKNIDHRKRLACARGGARNPDV